MSSTEFDAVIEPESRRLIGGLGCRVSLRWGIYSMGPEQCKNVFKELESRAEYWLCHPEELEPTDAIRQLRAAFRLWHYPSLGDHKSWLLFMPGRSLEDIESTYAREVTWKRTIDAERFADPALGHQMGSYLEPSLEVAD